MLIKLKHGFSLVKEHGHTREAYFSLWLYLTLRVCARQLDTFLISLVLSRQSSGDTGRKCVPEGLPLGKTGGKCGLGRPRSQAHQGPALPLHGLLVHVRCF